MFPSTNMVPGGPPPQPRGVVPVCSVSKLSIEAKREPPIAMRAGSASYQHSKFDLARWEELETMSWLTHVDPLLRIRRSRRKRTGLFRVAKRFCDRVRSAF